MISFIPPEVIYKLNIESTPESLFLSRESCQVSVVVSGLGNPCSECHPETSYQ